MPEGCWTLRYFAIVGQVFDGQGRRIDGGFAGTGGGVRPGFDKASTAVVEMRREEPSQGHHQE
ncbi:MAG: hypothetical protein KDN22_14935 [Verrucomicrobiae bacterium]|nr:hypothetical protein [Verrucomicrobiae bacterium]